ncbi:signal peptidase I [Saccharicrinis aurantiacus]|uniref:signal peptidase I n=1 Tax=Saccharicrinis aurantiacus TaxID=1849719 RepID=UPI000838DA45|nr:signal peptidase I [Saccharicrinis aurantiacus]
MRTKMKWLKFIAAALTYLLWVIWVGNLWLLPGILIVLDIYITKKVPWSFWKKTKDGSKPKAWIEWIDALIFALVAVYFINLFLFQNYKIPSSSMENSLLVKDHLFVSKVSYGPRLPYTPLSFPLLQNTIPILNTKSYFEWPKWDYKRLKGFGKVENNDIVVFNFPTGDTVPVRYTNPDIYKTSRLIGLAYANHDKSILAGLDNASQWEVNHKLKEFGRTHIYNHPNDYGEVVYRPVDRRDNYVKRCIAVAGDSIEMRHTQVYINGEKSKNIAGLQHWYNITTNGVKINQSFIDKLEISSEDVQNMTMGPSQYRIPLTEKKASEIKGLPFIRHIVMVDELVDSTKLPDVWPYSTDYMWSRDNFGPLYIPQKGATIQLNMKNIVLYDRVITAYEGNTLKVKNNTIYINEEEASEYTFKMDYYFMLGDNRHQSADSRYWGFVPEDHVVGKPLLVWLSWNQDKSLFNGKIRFDRFFKWVGNE